MSLKQTSRYKFQSFKKKQLQVQRNTSKSQSETEGNNKGWDETESVVKRKNVLSALSENVDSSQTGDSREPR